MDIRDGHDPFLPGHLLAADVLFDLQHPQGYFVGYFKISNRNINPTQLTSSTQTTTTSDECAVQTDDNRLEKAERLKRLSQFVDVTVVFTDAVFVIDRSYRYKEAFVVVEGGGH